MRPHLTETQRRILEAVCDERPGASGAFIARIFASRAGRPISAGAVNRIRARGGYRDRPGNNHLDGPGRDALRMLIEEVEGRWNCREIAGRFAELAGRSITQDGVRKFAARVFGPRPGPPEEGQARQEARFERRKLEVAAEVREKDLARLGRRRPGAPSPGGRPARAILDRGRPDE